MTTERLQFMWRRFEDLQWLIGSRFEGIACVMSEHRSGVMNRAESFNEA